MYSPLSYNVIKKLSNATTTACVCVPLTKNHVYTLLAAFVQPSQTVSPQAQNYYFLEHLAHNNGGTYKYVLKPTHYKNIRPI